MLARVFNAAFLCSRLQDQSPARQDQHLHKNPSTWRRACLRRDRQKGGRRQSQTGDPIRRRALLANTRVPQEQFGGSGLRCQHSAWPARQHSRSRDHPGAGAVPCGRVGGRSKGGDHQADPAPDAHVYCDAQSG